MKKLYNAVIFLIVFITTPVFASNDVDYTLTITSDYRFEEVIKYELTKYNKVVGGNNPYYLLIKEDKKPVDMMNTSFYKKVQTKENDKYFVTLTYTHSEYSLSNSLLVNTCFNKSDYKYDINHYAFSGSGGFRCMDADNLTINIISDLPLVSTNATVEGNKYTWKPTDYNFNMNIEFNKRYEEKKVDDTHNHPEDNLGTEEFINSGGKVNTPTQTNPSTGETPTSSGNQNINNDVNTNNTNILIYIAIGVVAFLIIISIILVILKRKSDELNKI